ncbi:hypothetical protein WKH56_20030 [Priestia sp. SB1]|uniref:hypothetical protein n=1 Tax=Priestia sp. SB1 TaxID=3132359 RepID=UPI00317D620C
MLYRFNKKEDDKMVRYFENNMNPERRIRLMYEEIIKSERMNALKLYNVKCWVYKRPYVKVIAATSEQNVRDLLAKEPVEIEDIVEVDIKTAQQIHEYILED